MRRHLIKYWREFLSGAIFMLSVLLIMGLGPATLSIPLSGSYRVTTAADGSFASTFALCDINNPATCIALGQQVMTASVPVAIASNQSSIPVTATGSVTANQGGAWSVGQTGTWTVGTNADGSVVPGTAGTKSLLTGCQFNSAAPSLSNGQQVACQTDAQGNVKTTGGVTDGSTAASALYSPIAGRGTTGIQKMVTCDKSAFYDAAATGSTQLVAASGSTVIYICGVHVHTGSTATNVKLVYGTGTNCVTSPVTITPAYQLLANAGFVEETPYWNGLATVAGTALCVNASAANPVQAEVRYAQF